MGKHLQISRWIPMRRSGRSMPTIPTCGCSTSRRTGWALQSCRHELGRVFCERVLEEWGFTLERYALHSVENCPDRPVRLVFDSDIQLTAPEITISDGLLRLDAHFRSADDYLLSRYSLAVHVIDPRTGERVAQGDVGVGPGAIVPLRSEIDISRVATWRLRSARRALRLANRRAPLRQGPGDGRSQRHAHAASLPPRLKLQYNT